MHISGSRSFSTGPAQTFALLTDSAVLARALPGLHSLTAASDTLYLVEMEVGVAAIKGRYQGRIELRDIIPAQSYRLVVQGEGAMGFVEADVAVHLSPNEVGGCTVAWDGHAEVGGVVAGVGQRMVGGVAKLLVSQFFNAVEEESRRHMAPDGQ